MEAGERGQGSRCRRVPPRRLAGFSFSLWATMPSGAIYTANLTLFPKVQVLALSKRFFDGLSTEQQDVLRQAAADARDDWIKTQPTDRELAPQVCSFGGRVVLMSDAELAAVGKRVAPLVAKVEADADTRAMLEKIRALRSGVDSRKAWAAPCEPTAKTDPSPAVSGPNVPTDFPDGTFRADLSDADLLAVGVDPGSARALRGLNELQVADGRFFWTSPYAHPPTVSGKAEMVKGHLVLTCEVDCGDLPGVHLIAGWHLDGDQLTLRARWSLPGTDLTTEWYPQFWTAKPWTRAE